MEKAVNNYDQSARCLHKDGGQVNVLVLELKSMNSLKKVAPSLVLVFDSGV